MQQPLFNDQAHIAEEFHLIDEHILQTTRLALFKINSYKLSLNNAAYCANQQELRNLINASLLHYEDNASILAGLGFFSSQIEN